MTPEIETRRIIGRWLSSLMSVTRQPNDNPVTLDTLKNYAELLARDLPSGAFTTDSLHAAAEGNTWFPAYAEISQRVAKWWAEHRPKTANAGAIEHAGHERDGRYAKLDAVAKSWVTFWFKRKAEEFGPIREGGDPSSAEQCASLIRQQSPEAWAYIASKDDRGQLVVSDEERRQIAAELRRALRPMPPGPPGPTHDRPVLPKPRPFGQLSPEQMEGLRQQNPLIVNTRKANERIAAERAEADRLAVARQQPEAELEDSPWER